MRKIQIGDRDVGPGHSPLVIAEVAQTHDGSLGTAHAYIDAVACAGAGAIKFQTHIAAAESTPGEPFRVKFSRQDANRYEYWKRMEFTREQWAGLAAHARERNLLFLSSPFSFEAADLLEDVGVPAWKVGSGELTNTPFLERLARTRLPILLSSGMSTWAELDAAVDLVRRAGAPVAMFQCTTSYPCPAERTGLNVLAEMRTRYGVPVGLSDHSATTYAGLAAVALGANLIEVHVTLSREAFGPDVPASITTAELADLARGVSWISKALGAPVDKDAVAGDMSELKLIFGKSIVARRALAAGQSIERDDLTLKKPGTGIPAARLDEILGRVLRRAVDADTLLQEDDLV